MNDILLDFNLVNYEASTMANYLNLNLWRHHYQCRRWAKSKQNQSTVGSVNNCRRKCINIQNLKQSQQLTGDQKGEYTMGNQQPKPMSLTSSSFRKRKHNQPPSPTYFPLQIYERGSLVDDDRVYYLKTIKEIVGKYMQSHDCELPYLNSRGQKESVVLRKQHMDQKVKSYIQSNRLQKIVVSLVQKRVELPLILQIANPEERVRNSRSRAVEVNSPQIAYLKEEVDIRKSEPAEMGRRPVEAEIRYVQKIQVREGEQVRQVLVQNDKQHLEQNIMQIIESCPEEHACKVVFQSYERVIENIDLEDGKKLEEQFKKEFLKKEFQEDLQYREQVFNQQNPQADKNNNASPSLNIAPTLAKPTIKKSSSTVNPVFLLGKCITKSNKGAEEGDKIEVVYQRKPSPATVYSMLYLAQDFGGKYRKGQYEIGKEEWNKSGTSFQELETNNVLRTKVTLELKEKIAEICKTKPESIIIDSILKDRVKCRFPQTPEVKVMKKDASCKIKNIQSIFTKLALCPQHFDSDWEYEFSEGGSQMRGRMPYYRPVGWMKYALKVDKFTSIDGNDKWLGNQNLIGEWAVMYHGVKEPTKEITQSQSNMKKSTITQIIVEQGLIPGIHNVHENDKPLLTKNVVHMLDCHNEPLQRYLAADEYECSVVGSRGPASMQVQANKIGKGVYGSPLVNTVCYAHGYSGPFTLDDDDNDDDNDKQQQKEQGRQSQNKMRMIMKPPKRQKEEYLVAFQCRVKPTSIYVCSDRPEYWVVRKPEQIRPYGLLVAKSSTIKEQIKTIQSTSRLYHKHYKDFIGVPLNLS